MSTQSFFTVTSDAFNDATLLSANAQLADELSARLVYTTSSSPLSSVSINPQTTLSSTVASTVTLLSSLSTLLPDSDSIDTFPELVVRKEDVESATATSTSSSLSTSATPTYPLNSNGCYICPSTPPPCPACPSGMVCNLSLQSCNSCPAVACIPASEQLAGLSPLSTSSSAPSATASSLTSPGNNDMIGPVIGGTVGGVAVAAILAFLIFWNIRRRKRQQHLEPDTVSNFNSPVESEKFGQYPFQTASPDLLAFNNTGGAFDNSAQANYDGTSPFYHPSELSQTGTQVPIPAGAAASEGLPISMSGIPAEIEQNSFSIIHKGNVSKPGFNKIREKTKKSLGKSNGVLAISNPRMLTSTYKEPTVSLPKNATSLHEQQQQQQQQLGYVQSSRLQHPQGATQYADPNFITPNGSPGAMALSVSAQQQHMHMLEMQDQQQQQSNRFNGSHPKPLVLSEKAMKQQYKNLENLYGQQADNQRQEELFEQNLQSTRDLYTRQQTREQEERERLYGPERNSFDGYSYPSSTPQSERLHTAVAQPLTAVYGAKDTQEYSNSLQPTLGPGFPGSNATSSTDVRPVVVGGYNQTPTQLLPQGRHQLPQYHNRGTSATSSEFSIEHGNAAHVIPIAYIPGVTSRPLGTAAPVGAATSFTPASDSTSPALSTAPAFQDAKQTSTPSTTTTNSEQYEEESPSLQKKPHPLSNVRVASSLNPHSVIPVQNLAVSGNQSQPQVHAHEADDSSGQQESGSGLNISNSTYDSAFVSNTNSRSLTGPLASNTVKAMLPQSATHDGQKPRVSNRSSYQPIYTPTNVNAEITGTSPSSSASSSGGNSRLPQLQPAAQIHSRQQQYQLRAPPMPAPNPTSSSYYEYSGDSNHDGSPYGSSSDSEEYENFNPEYNHNYGYSPGSNYDSNDNSSEDYYSTVPAPGSSAAALASSGLVDPSAQESFQKLQQQFIHQQQQAEASGRGDTSSKLLKGFDGTASSKRGSKQQSKLDKTGNFQMKVDPRHFEGLDDSDDDLEYELIGASPLHAGESSRISTAGRRMLYNDIETYLNHDEQQQQQQRERINTQETTATVESQNTAKGVAANSALVESAPLIAASRTLTTEEASSSDDQSRGRFNNEASQPASNSIIYPEYANYSNYLEQQQQQQLQFNSPPTINPNVTPNAFQTAWSSPSTAMESTDSFTSARAPDSAAHLPHNNQHTHHYLQTSSIPTNNPRSTTANVSLRLSSIPSPTPPPSIPPPNLASSRNPSISSGNRTSARRNRLSAQTQGRHEVDDDLLDYPVLFDPNDDISFVRNRQ